MAGTWQLKKKEGGGCSVSENSGGNRNGGTIKKYDRALIDVKTTTLIDRRTVCAANGCSRNRRGIASFSFFFFILLKVEEFVEEIISLFMDLSLRIEIVLKRGIKV